MKHALRLALLCYCLVLGSSAGFADDVDLRVSSNSTQNATGAIYQVDLLSEVGFQADTSSGRCLHLVAEDTAAGVVWVQPERVGRLPATIRWSLSSRSGFPLTLSLLHGTEELCADIKDVLSGPTTYRPFGIDEIDDYSDVGSYYDLLVSNGCYFRGVADHLRHRPGQGDVGCDQ